MNLKLIIATLAIAGVSVCAQAQQPSGAEVKTDVQNVLKIISGDKAKTQTYCQIDELSDQVTQAAQKKDNEKVEELSRKIEELEGGLGPEYLALTNELALVASRHADVVGEHDAAGQRYPARARTSLLPPKGKVAAAGGQLILMTSNAQEA